MSVFSLFGPVASAIGAVVVIGSTIGLFLVQLRRGADDATANLVKEQQATIEYLTGERKLALERVVTETVRAEAAEKHTLALQSDVSALRRLVSLETVPPAIQAALDAQVERLVSLLKGGGP